LTVGNDVESAVGITQSGSAKREIFDRAFEACDVDDFADVVLIFNEDEDAVEHILEEALCAEADADAEDSGGGQNWLIRDSDKAQNLEKDDES